MMLSPEDLQAISAIMRSELEPVNKRLDNIESRLSNVESHLEEIDENLEELRTASNHLLEWAEKVGVITKVAI